MEAIPHLDRSGALLGPLQGHAEAGNMVEDSQDRWLRLGVLTFGAATVLAATGLELHVRPTLLALLFLPYFFGSNAIWIGLYNVCPANAARRTRMRGGGCREVVANPAERRNLRMLAIRSFVQAIVMAGVATGLVISAANG